MFIEAKDDGGGGDNWTTGVRSHAKLQSPPTNQHPVSFAGRMPFLSPNQQCQSSEGKISHSMDLLTPSSPGGLLTLSLPTDSSWLPRGRVAMPLISPLMPVPPTFYPLFGLQSSSPHYLRDIIAIQPSRSTRLSSLVTLLHPQAQSSLKITNRSFRYAAPHLWNKLPPSLRVPCQSATLECSPPLPGSDSAPKSVVGVSHRVFHSRLKTHLFSRSCPS